MATTIVAIAVTKSIATNLCAWTRNSNAVNRAIKVPIASTIGSDATEEPTVRMGTMKSIVRRERVPHSDSVAITADVFPKSGCGRFSVCLFAIQ